MEGLSYFLLGPLQVRRGSAPVPVGAGKPLELLALLLVHRNRALSTDALVEQLWDGRPPETAAKIVQNAVSALRKAIGDGAGEVLVTRGRGYELVVPAGATDVDRFQALVERGRAELAGGQNEHAVTTLREALALWRGEPLADVAYHAFARDEIARLEEQRLVATEERVDADLATGGGAGLVAELEQLVAHHPLRERLRGQLMLALYRSGRQARALEVYAEGRRELSEQLGIEPGEALKQLERAILAHDPSLGAPPRDAAGAARRRTGGGLIVAGAGVLAVAVLAAVLVATSGGGGGAAAIAVARGNTIVLVDPAGRIVAQYPVGQTPTRLVTSGGVAWSLNADDGTISRIDLGTERPPRTFSPEGPGAPVDLAIGGGWLWVSEITPRHGSSGGFTATLVQIDPATLALHGRLRLPGTVVSGSVPLAFTAGKIWVGQPALVAVDPVAMRLAARVPGDVAATSLATGLDSLWVTAGTAGAALFRIDPGSARIVQQTELGFGPAGPVTVASGAVWMTDPARGEVWRIRPGPSFHTSMVGVVGAGAVGIAGGGDGVWVSSAVNGTLTRVDASGGSTATREIAIGGIPQAVAPAAKGVLVSVAGGDRLPAASTGQAGITPVSGARCGPVVHGSGAAQMLIVADLPLTGDVQSQGLPMSQAIIYALRSHDFRAGRYRLAFQACDDIDPATGNPDPASCRAHAQVYARTPSVIGMVGPFTSLCAVNQLAILNRAGPLAVVSPSNSRPGLTHGGPGEAADEPAFYRPTGIVSYARVIPADDLQGIAGAALAETFGLHRVFVYRSSWFTRDYPAVVGDAFAIAAGECGIHVIGLATPRPLQTASVVAQLKASGADGIFVSGGTQLAPPRGGPNPDLQSFLAAAERAMPGITLIGDAGLGTPPIPQGIHIAAEGVFDPAAQLPPAGVRFVHAFALTQPGGQVSAYSANAAQAAEVLLAAVARSSGTRASVTRELLKVKVIDGILGSFGFDRNGDMTTNLIPILHNGQLSEVLQVNPHGACP